MFKLPIEPICWICLNDVREARAKGLSLTRSLDPMEAEGNRLENGQLHARCKDVVGIRTDFFGTRTIYNSYPSTLVDLTD